MIKPDTRHEHACQRCGKPADCCGELVPNDDGFPTVICRTFHLDGGQVDPDFICDDCRPEPGDPDGEAFRGGEAAAYTWEQQIDAQKLK